MEIFKILIVLSFLFLQENLWLIPCYSRPLSGSVEEEKYIQQGQTSSVLDSITGEPVPNAIVSIPSKGIFTKTDKYGRFGLNTNLSGPDILSVNASGYKPFSVTINENSLKKPFVIIISKETGKELVIDSSLHHLGDNNFSEDSANANEFRLKSSGPFFVKDFFVNGKYSGKSASLKIGSVIGVDTHLAKRLNQNKIITSVSSPVQIFINSQKIGEIRINGDNQTIIFPSNILKFNSQNQIIVQTGKNLSTSYVDFDDMEFMNLILEFK